MDSGDLSRIHSADCVYIQCVHVGWSADTAQFEAIHTEVEGYRWRMQMEFL